MDMIHYLHFQVIETNGRDISSIACKNILEILYNINKNKNILKIFWVKIFFYVQLEMS